MKIVSLQDLEKTTVTMEGSRDVVKQVPVAAHDGSPLFCFRVLTIESRGYTPYHAHPFEHINYVIAGTGVLVTEKGEECRLEQGDFALVLPGEKHQYKNTSDTDSFVMICAVPKQYE